MPAPSPAPDLHPPPPASPPDHHRRFVGSSPSKPPPPVTTGTLGAFTVVHGAASQIALTHSGFDARVNHTLTATIQDAAGNTSPPTTPTVVAFTRPATGTVDGTRDRPVERRRDEVVVNGASGQIDLDAQAAARLWDTSYVITAGGASTLTSTMAASPTSIVADGWATSTITVRLKDGVGNDLTAPSAPSRSP